MLLGEEAGEAEVGDLDLAFSAVENVVRLDVPMQHIMAMHLGQPEGYLVKTVAAKVLRVVPVVARHNIIHGALVHQLEGDVNAFVSIVTIIVQVDTLDQFVAVQEGNQACFINDKLLFFLLDVLNDFHGEILAITAAPDLEDCSLAALAQLFQFLVVVVWIA